MDKIRFKKRPVKRPNFDLPPVFHFYVYINKVKDDRLFIEQRTDDHGSYFSIMRSCGVVIFLGKNRLAVFAELIDAKRELLSQLYKNV